jgi:excinuclease UvrABC nuclease subunit
VSRWERLKRRRRIRSLLFGLRSYQIAEVVGSNPRYDLLTSHVIVAKHLLDGGAAKFQEIRDAKRDAIDAQDWERAASLRDQERALLKGSKSETGVAQTVAKAAYDQTYAAVRARQGLAA